MTHADYDREHARETIARDVAIFGTTFTYDGRPLDPAKVLTYRREDDGTVTEVEEYDEWRLTGQPLGHRDGDLYPPYDFTARSREHIEQIRDLYAKIRTGERQFDDAKLVHRHVTITRTAWTEED